MKRKIIGWWLIIISSILAIWPLAAVLYLIFSPKEEIFGFVAFFSSLGILGFGLVLVMLAILILAGFRLKKDRN